MRIHEQEFSYHCEHCDKSFKQYPGLFNHKCKKKHNGIENDDKNVDITSLKISNKAKNMKVKKNKNKMYGNNVKRKLKIKKKRKSNNKKAYKQKIYSK